MVITEDWTLFLDRDGVINVMIEGEYIHDVDRLEIRRDFWNAAPLLFSKFSRKILVTNQQGVDKGLCTQAQVDVVHGYMQSLMKQHGLSLDAIYCCPHLQGSGCGCRKPDIGMALMAKRDFPEIDLSKSVMIGDKLSDVQFAKNCGMVSVLLKEEGIPTHEEKEYADYIVTSLVDFVACIK